MRRVPVGDQKKICVLIAACLPATRNALKIFVNEQPGFGVVAEAGDSHELFKKIEITSPDIVLLDWELLDRATPILIKAMRALDQKQLVIVLSPDTDHQQPALEAGADGFVDIGNPPKELLLTINELFRENE